MVAQAPAAKLPIQMRENVVGDLERKRRSDQKEKCGRESNQEFVGESQRPHDRFKLIETRKIHENNGGEPDEAYG